MGADQTGTAGTAPKSPVTPPVSNATLSENREGKPSQRDPETNRKSSTDWWLVELTGCLVGVGLLQAYVFWVQAGRLKQTIRKMDEIAGGQTADMKASISEAGRAASAMEGVAAAMALSAASSAQMAKTTREFWEKQMRAYVSVSFAAAISQNVESNWRTEVRLILSNDGLTPAHDVVYESYADVLPFPLPGDFEFKVPDIPVNSVSAVGPRQNRIMTAAIPKLCSNEEVHEYTAGNAKRVYMYGTVRYRDAFGISRYANFSQSIVWFKDGATMGVNTHRHNDSD